MTKIAMARRTFRFAISTRPNRVAALLASARSAAMRPAPHKGTATHRQRPRGSNSKLTRPNFGASAEAGLRLRRVDLVRIAPGPGPRRPAIHCLPVRRAARSLGERRGEIGREGSPDFDMEGRLGAAPEHDLHFVEQSARREPDRKRARIEIERAAGVEDTRRGRTAGDDADLPMRDVDETMRGSLEHRLRARRRYPRRRRRPRSAAIRPGRATKPRVLRPRPLTELTKAARRRRPSRRRRAPPRRRAE